jgi:hypothetical protein
MRQNVIIALLSVIATLLAVSVFAPSHMAIGQNAGGTAAVVGDMAVASAPMTGGNAALYIYEAGKKKLLAYVLGNNGLEIRAVRDITFDLQATDFSTTAGKVTRVSQMKKAIQSQAKSEE